MNRFLGGLYLSIPTVLILWLISISISCPKNARMMRAECSSPEIDINLFLFAFIFMFIVGAVLGAKEITQQAKASHPVCPSCGHQVGFVRRSLNKTDIVGYFKGNIICKKCGETFNESKNH